ncbi:MAG: glycosyltransferase family 4 protein [Comamonadaceae bacterium]|nr:glycosyltransferase family 4 protein [Comamonadaceae bacterium]
MPETLPVGRPWRVMLASSTHAVGHGVAVVLALQAGELVRRGMKVVVAGPASGLDFSYPGCARLNVADARGVALAAERLGIDLIVAFTPPFYSVVHEPGCKAVMAFDHGEPPPDWFADHAHRIKLLEQKDRALRLAKAVYANSKAVAGESRTPVTGVMPLANGHLGQWSDDRMERRQMVRKALGWSDRFIVLNVCRFHQAERQYKGVDTYSAVQAAVRERSGASPGEILFVQCGKALEADVKAVSAAGLVAMANPSDSSLIDIYLAADAYANFSRWEGYNLGIGQALAMGLPTLASDIPAHREFGVEVTNDVDRAADWVAQRWRERARVQRVARPTPWEPHLTLFAEVVQALCVEASTTA